MTSTPLTLLLLETIRRCPSTTAFIILVVLMFVSMLVEGVPWILP